MAKLIAGTHIKVSRLFYSHHGIYIGNGRVIHYSGMSNGLHKGEIELTSLSNFLGDKDNYEIVDYPSHKQRYTNSEVVERAYSRLHEDEYNILFNNCEHFACWCITGEYRSQQVRNAILSTALSGISGSSVTTCVVSAIVVGSLIFDDD